MINFIEFVNIKQILEAHNNKAVIAFTRMQGVTKGHLELMNDIVTLAKKEKAMALLFLSHKQDKKKNPLSYEEKYEYISKYAPDGLVIVKSDAKNIFDVVKHTANLGATDVTLVMGEDREANFARLSKYKEELGITNIKLHVGKRTEGVSGSTLRQYAIDNDYKNFAKVAISGDSKDTKEIFKKIRDRLTESNDLPLTEATTKTKQHITNALVAIEKAIVEVNQAIRYETNRSDWNEFRDMAKYNDLKDALRNLKLAKERLSSHK